MARRRLMSPRDTILSAALSSIDQQCRTVGIKVIESVIIAIKKAVEEQDINEAYAGLRSVESFLGMFRLRMFSVLKMNGSVARTALTVGSAPEVAVEEPVVPAAFSTAYGRDIISKPFWQFGTQLRRLVKGPLLSAEDLDETAKKIAGMPPFTVILSTVRMLESLQTLTVDETAKLAIETKGFAANYKLVLEKITGTEQSMDTPAAMTRVLEKQGVAKVMTLIAVARVANSVPKGGLLNLRQLYAHTLSATLIAYEIGRLFRLANDILLAAAGLVHDSGRWMFALGEPGAYAVSLALAENENTTVEQAEKSVFGITHLEAGRKIVSLLGEPELMQAAASLHHDPSKVADQECSITVCVVHLAHLLAMAALAGSAVDAKNILAALRDPTYPVWSLLKARGVELPFDTPELVDTMAAIANTSNWTAFQFLDKAN